LTVSASATERFIALLEADIAVALHQTVEDWDAWIVTVSALEPLADMELVRVLVDLIPTQCSMRRALPSAGAAATDNTDAALLTVSSTEALSMHLKNLIAANDSVLYQGVVTQAIDPSLSRSTTSSNLQAVWYEEASTELAFGIALASLFLATVIYVLVITANCPTGVSFKSPTQTLLTDPASTSSSPTPVV
jgi:hypothetical protein